MSVTRPALTTPRVVCSGQAAAPGSYRTGASSMWLVLITVATLLSPAAARGDESLQSQLLIERGRQIYTNACASCHGEAGQGVESQYPDPLIGDSSIGQLTEVIADTMPEGEPEACQGEDAAAVAAFIHQAFYSEAAQIRNRPPRQMLQRLTANQFRQSLADLFAVIEGTPDRTEETGLKAVYFNGTRWKDKAKKIERVDPFIDFDFQYGSPADDIEAGKFYIYWEGGLKIDRTGRYELIVDSTCSMTMKFGGNGRVLIDNHVQSGDRTEFRRSIYLLAGRTYPLSIEFIQRERSTELPPAKIRFSWVPPGGVQQTVPTEHLTPTWTPPTFAPQTILPPDDRSYGYERGIEVNPQWDEATTAAILEFATIANDELWPSYRQRHKDDPGDDRSKLKAMLSEIITRAFRMPLSDELRQRYVDRPVDASPADADAIKLSLLLSLKSPRFMYPGLDRDVPPQRRIVNTLSQTLHDGLTTKDWIIDQAQQGHLATAEGPNIDAIRNLATELAKDPRTDAKIYEFLTGWLNLDHVTDIGKDQNAFPGFDQTIAADLRHSLDRQLMDFASGRRNDYRELFSARQTYTSRHLMRFYGDSFAAEDPSEPVQGHFAGLVRTQDSHLRRSVADPQRLGVLNHPYLMSSLAYHDTTSPIHRGVFLVRFLLGRTLRPPNAAFSPLSPDLHPDLNTRERVSLQTSPESCQVCHDKINLLGFTLENFDAAGRFRDLEMGRPVDASGKYTDRRGNEITFGQAKDLADYLTASDDAVSAFVNRAFQHFTKQPAAAYGPDTLETLTERFRNDDYHLRRLIIEIATIAATDPMTES